MEEIVSASDRETLKKRFKEADGWLLLALNERNPISEDVIEKLRRDVEECRTACIKVGIEVETYAEFGARKYRERMAFWRPKAIKAAERQPLLSYSARHAIEAVAAAAGAVMAIGHGNTIFQNILYVVVSGVCGWIVAKMVFIYQLPSPATQIGFTSAKDLIDLRDCFLPGSPARHDYEYAWRLEVRKKRPSLIRVR